VTSSEVSVGAWIAFGELAGPILIVTLVIGLLAGVVQTATQIREASVPFVLKLAGLAVLTTAAGPLMMHGVEHYAAQVINAIPAMIHG
jgi:flagellar biosynthesis protein FliQ